jgi:hypothetical protein
MGLSSAALLALAAVLLQFVAAERLGRRAWRLVLGWHAEQGPYREAKVVVRHGERAPGAVRLAAFTCLLFGQMFVPGAWAVYVGLSVYFGLSSHAEGLGAVLGFPGLVVAGALWVTGYALLLRTGWRHAVARFALLAAVALNVAILVGYALFACVATYDVEVPAILSAYVHPEVIAGTIVYALLSLGQAALLAFALAVEAEDPLARTPTAPQLPRWLLRLLQRKRSRATA